MLLVKCKCGCLFTLSDSYIDRPLVSCPSCRGPITIDLSSDGDSDRLEKAASISRIPDNAKITVTFDT